MQLDSASTELLLGRSRPRCGLRLQQPDAVRHPRNGIAERDRRGRARAERTLRERRTAGGGRRVIGVDLGRAGVGVTHPLLDRTQRRAGRSHLGSKRVAHFVEGQFGRARAREGSPEAFAQLGSVEDMPRRRVREDEVPVAAPVRALEVPLELTGQRHYAERVGTLRPGKLEPYWNLAPRSGGSRGLHARRSFGAPTLARERRKPRRCEAFGPSTAVLSPSSPADSGGGIRTRDLRVMRSPEGDLPRQGSRTFREVSRAGWG